MSAVPLIKSFVDFADRAFIIESKQTREHPHYTTVQQWDPVRNEPVGPLLGRYYYEGAHQQVLDSIVRLGMVPPPTKGFIQSPGPHRY